MHITPAPAVFGRFTVSVPAATGTPVEQVLPSRQNTPRI
jgi:hypothetical protein